MSTKNATDSHTATGLARWRTPFLFLSTAVLAICSATLLVFNDLVHDDIPDSYSYIVFSVALSALIVMLIFNKLVRRPQKSE